MTTRPGVAVVDVLRKTRSKHLCHAIQIARTDGFVLRITDHDRTLTFDGNTYQPVLMGELSAERREAALRSGNQEATGLIDGTIVTIPDMLGNRYRGAEVRDVIFDWTNPFMAPVRDRKWIRNTHWTGTKWVATFEGRTQVLQRNAGGRFGGTFATKCPFKLGDASTCKRDISTWRNSGVRVQTVVVQGWKATFRNTTFLATYADDWFRDGDITWIWAVPQVESQVTATTTSTTLTDSTRTWTVDEHVGKDVRIENGQDGPIFAYGSIVSNTATTLTYSVDTPGMAGWTIGTWYDIVAHSPNNGVVTPVVRYTDSNREMEFLLPTPFPIAVGDSGILNVGCDGLFSTCAGKFADADHPLNFGGDPFAPSALEVIEPPEPQ